MGLVVFQDPKIVDLIKLVAETEEYEEDFVKVRVGVIAAERNQKLVREERKQIEDSVREERKRIEDREYEF